MLDANELARLQRTFARDLASDERLEIKSLLTRGFVAQQIANFEENALSRLEACFRVLWDLNERNALQLQRTRPAEWAAFETACSDLAAELSSKSKYWWGDAPKRDQLAVYTQVADHLKAPSVDAGEPPEFHRLVARSRTANLGSETYNKLIQRIVKLFSVYDHELEKRCSSIFDRSYVSKSDDVFEIRNYVVHGPLLEQYPSLEEFETNVEAMCVVIEHVDHVFQALMVSILGILSDGGNNSASVRNIHYTDQINPWLTFESKTSYLQFYNSFPSGLVLMAADGWQKIFRPDCSSFGLLQLPPPPTDSVDQQNFSIEEAGFQVRAELKSEPSSKWRNKHQAGKLHFFPIFGSEAKALNFL
ncbi:hypothetical protein JKI95_08540 [Corynebacterium aquatimens]|uniref:hypothetical protein n=1 Tax=Corynebacterium TaxID=1716 RepID=UPI001F2D97D0|nr:MULTISPECIES: hypothetical protein [Corynebacterium]QYH19241.1 hypothetical protein JKI95_08540 [Corynebacterium aquatimens]UIZ91872.1 hypothetical protein JZY91_09305 [Corynebacterium sp. CNCTC7651]